MRLRLIKTNRKEGKGYFQQKLIERRAGDIRSCKMKVEIFDNDYATGNSMDQDTSDRWFDILSRYTDGFFREICGHKSLSFEGRGLGRG